MPYEGAMPALFSGATDAQNQKFLSLRESPLSGCGYRRGSQQILRYTINADMPARVKPFVRLSLIGKHCRTYYYEYRNGTRLISPDVQEEVRGLFREAGWNEEVHFDSYIEDYEW